MTADATADRLVTPRFAWVVIGALAYFISLGMLAPVVPRYVEEHLDGNGLAVGLAFGSWGVAAGAVRTLAGRLGDRYGRRPLAVGGAVLAGVAILGYGLVESLAWLVVVRFVSGIGEAGFFIGSATAAQEMTTDDRRGEAASLYSVAIYGGLVIGPATGEWLYQEHGPDRVWLASGVLALVSAALGLLIPAGIGLVDHAEERIRTFIHPAARLPGAVLLLGLACQVSFNTFLALYVDELGLGGAGPYFVVYGLLVLAVRILGARVPDRLGPPRTATISLLASIGGVLFIGLIGESWAIYAGTALIGVGSSLFFPALFSLAVNRAHAAERSHAIGSFSLFFDLANGVGAPLLGLSVFLFHTEAAAFLTASGSAVAALVLVRTRLRASVATTPS